MFPGSCVIDNDTKQLFTLTLLNVLAAHSQTDGLVLLNHVDPPVLVGANNQQLGLLTTAYHLILFKPVYNKVGLLLDVNFKK